MKKDEKLEREIGVSSGSAADVEAIMRKYDRESNTRIWEGTPKIVVSCVAALFCLYVTLFANFMEQVRLSSFLGTLIVIGYMTYPARKGKVRVNSMPWYDIVLMVLGAGAFFFYVFNAQRVVKLHMRITKETLYTVVGVWNSWYRPALFLTDSQWQPLQLYLRRVLVEQTATVSEDFASKALLEAAQKQEISNNQLKYTVIIVSTLPMITAYPFFQRYFVKGVMLGSLKG